MLINKEVPLDISLPLYGIYYLGAEGATGKTYVYKLLRSCNEFEEGVAFLCSANTIMNEQVLIQAIDSYSGKYMFFDRADQYMTDEILNSIKRKQKCYIMLDLKDYSWWWRIPALFCRIVRTKDLTRLEGLY